MKNKFRKNEAITLVALIVTIILLLILAGISIASLTGNGLFEKAQLAKEKQENAQIKENETLGDYENEIGQYVDGNRETITVDKEEYYSLVNKVNNIGKMYSTKELITTNIPSSTTTSVLKLTLEPGKYVISGSVDGTGFGLGIGYNNYIFIDNEYFWADEGHSNCFRGTGTIIREIIQTKDIYLNVYCNTTFTMLSGKLNAIRISD